MYNKRQNIGEKDEVLCIRKLLESDNRELINIFGYEASDGIKLIDPSSKEVINDIQSIRKASTKCKSDIYIKFNATERTIGISIKSFTGRPPSILNHTWRSKFIKNHYINEYIPQIDTVIKKYIMKRSNDSGECIMLNDIEFTDNERNSLIKILVYFMFFGTAKLGKSESTADAILTWRNGEIINYTLCNTEETKIKYIENKWDKFEISLRTKGINPNNITKSDEPWIFNYKCDENTIKRKGGLHIRLKY
tara:strand:+ start:407 stop:1156 length:750 start_codon:yes stop_codon:yes gene_type:complete